MELTIGLFCDTFPPYADEAALSAFACAERINAELGRCFIVAPKVPGYKDRLPYDVIRTASLPLPKSWDRRLPLTVGRGLAKGLTEREPDLLHVHSPFTICRLARWLKELMQIPLVISIHERYSDLLDRLFTWAPARERVQRYMVQNLEAADEVWVDSHALAADIRKLGYTGGFVRQSVGCGLSVETVPDEWLAVVEKLHTLERESVLLLCVGRLNREDRFLLRAMCRLRDTAQKIKLVIIGDGPARKAWENGIGELKLDSVVQIVSRPVDKELIRAYYARASLLLCPWADALSSVAEASALRRPALMLRDDCIADGLKNGVNSFLTQPDPVLLADDIRGIVSDSARLKRVGDNAYDTFYVPGADAARTMWNRYELVCRLSDEHKEEQKRELEYVKK